MKSMKAIDVTGQRFGRLVVLEFADSQHGHRRWRCRCDCGKTKVIELQALRGGRTKSCGCLAAEGRPAIHGHARRKSGAYRSWIAMRKRCASTSSYYGGRGIKVCKQWDRFENFLDDMGERPKDMTLDRIDPFGDYEPSNCRWATRAQQQRNKRAVVLEARVRELELELCAILNEENA